jgi:ERCC4-related helicase
MKQTDDLVKAVFTKEAPQHLLLFVSVRIAAAIIVRFVMRLL